MHWLALCLSQAWALPSSGAPALQETLNLDYLTDPPRVLWQGSLGGDDCFGVALGPPQKNRESARRLAVMYRSARCREPWSSLSLSELELSWPQDEEGAWLHSLSLGQSSGRDVNLDGQRELVLLVQEQEDSTQEVLVFQERRAQLTRLSPPGVLRFQDMDYDGDVELYAEEQRWLFVGAQPRSRSLPLIYSWRAGHYALAPDITRDRYRRLSSALRAEWAQCAGQEAELKRCGPQLALDLLIAEIRSGAPPAAWEEFLRHHQTLSSASIDLDRLESLGHEILEAHERSHWAGEQRR